MLSNRSGVVSAPVKLLKSPVFSFVCFGSIDVEAMHSISISSMYVQWTSDPVASFIWDLTMRGRMGHYSELACAYTYETKLAHISQEGVSVE